MIASVPKEYLLLREVARVAGVSAKVLRGQVNAGRIPERFVMRSGEVRPVIRIHRSWLDQVAAAAPALTCETHIPWGTR